MGDWALQELRPDDRIIGADRGALFLVRRGIRPDLSLGDFDSVTPEEKEDIRLHSARFTDCDPIRKDWTDTEMAYREAATWKPREIVLFGALGTRLDHSLANVHLLWKARRDGIGCRIIGEYNEVFLADGNAEVERGRFNQVSLLPLSMEVTGITLRGFRYPLRNATLSLGESLGVSNVLVEPKGRIEVAAGQLLVIRSIAD